ncbi:hypothetical protein [Maribacter luteus]|uniref:Uncharacterized protein n=1 Tax=Maribacter luteus TaxID=2594478 RepID=A0A6I2MLQ6_9FLAO|nr:hypothetical protein [Maribacter luteus]MRX64668.1 hypothetical protein [Maribacter luteus]
MSDNYITICTKEEVENPIDLGQKILQWLQSNEIIEQEPSDCILSTKTKGYKPGKNHTSAIGYDEDLLRLKVCGVEVKTEREVFNVGAFTPMTKLECPNCRANRFEGITPQDFFTDNCTKEQLNLFHTVFPEFDKWTNNEKATLVCPHCSNESNLSDYGTDQSIAFSNLGFTFWNWPDLNEEFLMDLKSVIGIEIVRMNGHL